MLACLNSNLRRKYEYLAGHLFTSMACHTGDRKKKALNVGRSGGSAGLDDYSFDGAPLDDDDYDFM